MNPSPFYTLRNVLEKIVSVIDYIILRRFVYPLKTVVFSIEQEWEALKELIYGLLEEVEVTVDGLYYLEKVIKILESRSE